MSDGDLTINFAADASAFRQGCEQAAAAVGAIAPRVQSLGAAFVALAGGAQRSLAALTISAQAQQAAFAGAVTTAAATQAQASDQTTQQLTRNNARMLAGFKATMDQTVAAFTRGLLQMAEGSRTFTQVMARVGQQILEAFVAKVVDPMIEKWLWKEAQQLLATVTGAAQRTAASLAAGAAAAAAAQATARAQVAPLIGLAGAGGVASMAAAPWPLDMGAPAFGASMAAAAAGYMAAGGFDVPAGLNPVTQLHAEEMVLPARLANPMRDLLAGFGAPRGGRAGDAHLHYAPTINAPQAQSLRQMLTDQGADMLAFLQRALRDGALRLA